MDNVNIKFNPKEWDGGYVGLFATETDYNDAWKLLPNVSKIGNNEIRYIPRDIAQLPEAYLWIDNFGRSNTDYLNSNSFISFFATLPLILMLLGVYESYLFSVSTIYLPFLIPLCIGLFIGSIVFMKINRNRRLYEH